MRALRLLFVALLLPACVFTLAALFDPAQRPAPATAVLTAVVFLPLWYTAGFLTLLSGLAAGRRRRTEAALFCGVLAVPALAVTGGWRALHAWHPGPVPLDGFRTLSFLLTGGVLAWCCALFATAAGPPGRVPSPAAVFFIPLWLGICLVNAVLGVREGYAVAEEAALALVNVLPPAVLSVLAGHASHRRAPDGPRPRSCRREDR